MVIADSETKNCKNVGKLFPRRFRFYERAEKTLHIDKVWITKKYLVFYSSDFRIKTQTSIDN